VRLNLLSILFESLLNWTVVSGMEWGMILCAYTWYSNSVDFAFRFPVLYHFWKFQTKSKFTKIPINRVIRKSLREFRPLRHSSRDGHAEGRMSTEGETLQVSVLKHVCGRNLITGLTSAASPRVDISSTCKVGQKLGVSLPLLTCSLSAWPSRLLYRRVRNSRRDLWITPYITLNSTVS
jgi:hypothetical protein